MYYTCTRSWDNTDIFLDEKDCARMKLLLYMCNTNTPLNIRDHFARGLTYPDLWAMEYGKPIVEVGAWCLMPDRYYLALREIRDGGITRFMLKLSTAYSMYFNRKMARKGALIQSPYRSERVEGERHSGYIFSFVHLNPVGLLPGEAGWARVGIKNILSARDFLKKYQYSSLPDYMEQGRRAQSKIIKPEGFSWKYTSIEHLNDSLLDWLAHKPDN